MAEARRAAARAEAKVGLQARPISGMPPPFMPGSRYTRYNPIFIVRLAATKAATDPLHEQSRESEPTFSLSWGNR